MTGDFTPLAEAMGRAPRFVLFAGKGGVGKTTCAAGAALACAATGQRTLVFSTDPAHSLADCLGCAAGGDPSPVPGQPGLDLMEIDAGRSLEQFRARHGPALTDLLETVTYLTKEEASGFAQLGLPGIDELMGLGRIADLLAESHYQRLVWDSAPTGHTLRLLALPDLLDEWVRFLATLQAKHAYVIERLAGGRLGEPAGDLLFQLKRMIRRFRAILSDRTQTGVLVTTVAEPVAVAEIKRLIDSLDAGSLPLLSVVVNHWMADPGQCLHCRTRRAAQETQVQRLRWLFPHLPLILLPEQAEAIAGTTALSDLLGTTVPGLHAGGSGS